jgi:hypothetical protein
LTKALLLSQALRCRIRVTSTFLAQGKDDLIGSEESMSLILGQERTKALIYNLKTYTAQLAPVIQKTGDDPNIIL